MAVAIDRLGAWLIDLGVMAAAWLSLMMIAAVACRQPIRRRDLARAALIGALALGPLSLLPIGRLGLVEAASRAIGRDQIADLSPEGGWPRAASISWAGRVLTVGYLVVVAAGVAWSLLGAWAMGRLVRSAGAVSPEAAFLFARLPFSGTPRRRPALVRSDRVGRPVLVGGRRPTIVIPGEWDRPDPDGAERLRLALLHELAHAERGDPLFHWLAGIAQAAWFALPPAWWLARQLRVDQEILADDRAAGAFGGATAAYACSLVAMASGRPIASPMPSPGDSAPPGALPTINPDGSPLVRRVAMLVRRPFPIESEAPAWWRRGLPAVSATLLVLASRLSVGIPPPEAAPAIAPASAEHAPSSFRFLLRELEVGPAAVGSPLSLPVPLPERFSLTMDLWADPGSLGSVAVAGILLGEPGTSLSASGPESWHRVRLEVDDEAIRLWVNGQAGPVVRLPDDPGGWLTILPAPDRPIRIRDLLLEPADAAATGRE